MQKFAILCLLICLAGCSDQDNGGATKIESRVTNRVVAVSYPLQFLTSRIAGPDIQVDFPVPTGQDPRIWQPSLDEIQNMQSADLVVANGPGIMYAEWLSQVTLARSKILNTSDKLGLADFIQIKDYQLVHTHGPEGEHSHALMIPYTWLDPAMARKQAAAIAARLSTVYPDRQSTFESNLKTLNADLDRLTDLLNSGTRSASIISSNPNLKFLTRAAKLEDKHMLWFEPPADDKEQADRQQELARAIVESKPSAILISGSPVVAGIQPDGDSVVINIDTLDHPPAAGDYLSAMQKNIESLLNAIQ